MANQSRLLLGTTSAGKGPLQTASGCCMKVTPLVIVCVWLLWVSLQMLASLLQRIRFLLTTKKFCCCCCVTVNTPAKPLCPDGPGNHDFLRWVAHFTDVAAYIHSLHTICNLKCSANCVCICSDGLVMLQQHLGQYILLDGWGR